MNADAVRHLLALRLANRPTSEIDAFQKRVDPFQQLYLSYSLQLNDSKILADDAAEEQQERIMTVIEKLRGVFNTLTARLQACSKEPLPGSLAELERCIFEHKVSIHHRQEALVPITASRKVPRISVDLPMLGDGQYFFLPSQPY